MLRVKNVTKSFGERVLFENFSVDIQQGDLVIINGVSGSGKTTLLNMIGGIEPFEEGNIYIDELDLRKNKDIIKAFREKLGFLFQNFALIDNKTVEENILLVDKKYRTDETVESVLDKVGLAGYGKRKIYTLSGGEQQRVAIARLFMKKCDIVLADEPTGSLDKQNAKVVVDYLLELNRMGKTIILVTHDEEIKQIGGNIIEI